MQRLATIVGFRPVLSVLAVALLGLTGMTCPGPYGLGFAQKAALTPAKVKQIKKISNSFNRCRKSALKLLKQGQQERFEKALTKCKESFPGADLNTNCKRNALKRAKAKGTKPDVEVRKCRRYLIAATFDPEIEAPFFLFNKRMFFAGIGMNEVLPLRGLNLPNFDCSGLQEIAASPKKAQYFLFGNSPRLFGNFAQMSGPDVVKALRFRRPKRDGVDVRGFGRIFGNPVNKNSAVFFPAAACAFEAEPGPLFAGLSAYYLIDYKQKAIAPYFGIAYYKSGQAEVNTDQLVSAMLEALGPKYQVFRKNSSVRFIAAAPINERDAEKDPKNLCNAPRPHQYVAVVQGQKDKPEQPEYALVANVAQLCSYGDTLANRIAKR